MDAGSPAARLLKLPRRRKTPPRRTTPPQPPGTQAQRSQAFAALLASQAGGAVSVAQVNEVLAAGIQDITNAMVESFQLNDVLRMILETMFRALGFRRMVFCLREARTDQLTGRFGLGEGSEAVVRAHEGAAERARRFVHGRVPAGRRHPHQRCHGAPHQCALALVVRGRRQRPSFLLLPLQMKGQPFALIYADQAVPGGIVVDDKALGLLRTLRNQAVMAFARRADFWRSRQPDNWGWPPF